MLMTLAVLRVSIKLLLADGVRGGWKMWDFAPDNLGATP
jgi:hypothetical protein